LIPAHLFLLIGYFNRTRHIRSEKLLTEQQFGKQMYLLGIGIMLFSFLLLGFWGWQGAFSLGAWEISTITLLLSIAFVWLNSRLRPVSFPRAHWLKPPPEKSRNFARSAFWSVYYSLRKLSGQLTILLESDGGILWALLFLILFASLLSEGIR
jgi:hypothetical protein